MSYFSNFPYIQYEYPDKVSRAIKNISIRPAVVDEFFGVYSNFDTYTIEDGDTPETLAYDLFGDVNLHWTIMLANNILNIYKDWPMTGQQFDVYLRKKYAFVTSNSGKQVELDDETYQEFIEFVGVPDSDYATIKQVKNVDGDSDTITIRPAHFKDENGKKYNYESVVGTNMRDVFNNLIILPILTPVSIYDEEMELNDKKRSIIVPKFEMIQQMKSELNRIVNE